MKIEKSDIDESQTSDSDESNDKETLVKKFFPGTFHRKFFAESFCISKAIYISEQFSSMIKNQRLPDTMLMLLLPDI